MIVLCLNEHSDFAILHLKYPVDSIWVWIKLTSQSIIIGIILFYFKDSTGGLVGMYIKNQGATMQFAVLISNRVKNVRLNFF